MRANMQPAADVEAEVRARLPHLRLYHASYQAKGLPASWRCTLHNRTFRANASTLIRPRSIGCPDCIEERAHRKRKQKRADPDLEQHLSLIREHCSEGFVRTYRLHCEGVKWEQIGAEFGISLHGVQGRLRRIAAVLSEAAQQPTKPT
jgi:hypothetical protein